MRYLAVLLAVMTLIGPVSLRAADDKTASDDSEGLVTLSEDLVINLVPGLQNEVSRCR